MKHLWNMYEVELKKILARKALWVAALCGILLLSLMEGSNLLFVKYSYPDGKVMNGMEYYRLKKEKGEELSGRPFDQEFMDEVRNIIASYALDAGYLTPEEIRIAKSGELSEYELNQVGSALQSAAEESGIANAYGLLAVSCDDAGEILTVSEEEWYQKMDALAEVVYAGTYTPERARDYWLSRYQGIKQPYIYRYNFGYESFFEEHYVFVWLIIILVAISLAGVFADERSTRMDAMILSSRNGRDVLGIAKLLAGVTVGVTESLLLFAVSAGTSLLFYGSSGGDGILQMYIYGTAWNLTMRQGLWIFFGMTILLGVFLSCFIMFLSERLSGVQVISITMALFIVSFFNLPEKLGMVTKLWQLRPNVLLHPSIFRSDLLVGRFTAFTVAVVLYIVLAVVLSVVTASLYKKSQVRGR